MSPLKRRPACLSVQTYCLALLSTTVCEDYSVMGGWGNVVWGQKYKPLKKWSDLKPINFTVTNYSGKIWPQKNHKKNISVYISSFKIKLHSLNFFIGLSRIIFAAHWSHKKFKIEWGIAWRVDSRLSVYVKKDVFFNYVGNVFVIAYESHDEGGMHTLRQATRRCHKLSMKRARVPAQLFSDLVP